MGSRTQGDINVDGAVASNTLSVTETTTLEGSTYSGAAAITRDPDDYTLFAIPNDGTNEPWCNTLGMYDTGTGTYRRIYLDNGTIYAI